MNLKYKVLAIDGWTLGASNFESLCEPLSKLNIEILLIHLGSYGDEVRTSKSEKIGKLNVRDISYYNGLNYEKILKLESPDLVIFLSTETFLHRAFIRYCNKLKIPTLYHFHGILSIIYMEYTKKGVNINKHYNISIFAHLFFILKRIPKAIQYTVFIYITSLFKTNASLNEYLIFLKDIFYGFLGKKNLKSSFDSITTYGAVFIPQDVNYAEKKCGIKKENILVIGNPDFVKLGLEDTMLGARLENSNTLNEVIYIDTAFFISGLHFKTIDDYINYLLILKIKLNELGYKLIIKPHPATVNEKHHLIMQNKGLLLCDNNNFISNLLNCQACICEPSSLFLIPAMIGTKILLPQFGKLQNQLYSDLVLSYPRSFLLSDLNDLSTILDDQFDNKNIIESRIWIESNSGPKPLSNLGERVSNFIFKIITK
jgi:hypothetical protein